MNESEQVKQPYDHPAQIAENLRRWREAMEISHSMLIAGLRDQVGSNGDIRQAYREWQQQNRGRKMRAYEKAAQRFFDRHHADRAEED